MSTLFEEAQKRWPDASPEAIDSILWMTPYPFVSFDEIVASLEEMRQKWGANIADAIKGEMDEFDAAFETSNGSKTMTVKPFTPHDAKLSKAHDLPDEVIMAVNELLSPFSDDLRIVLRQRDVIERIQQKLPGISRKTIFDLHMLDFESVYCKAGWKVTYDKPGYNESYEPTFIFTPAS